MIVGASFAGLHLAREIAHLAHLVDIVLVDPNPTVEYTPGILATLTTPSRARDLVFDLESCIPRACRWIRGRVTAVKQRSSGIGGSVEISREPRFTHGSDTVDELLWDWCVLATGSTYPAPMKPPPSQAGAGGKSLAGRMLQLSECAAEIASAPSVLIIGGGPVGVELAAEIAVAFKLPRAKAVTLLSAAPTLMQGLPESLGTAAERWLTRHGVNVVLGERVEPAPVSAAAGEGTGASATGRLGLAEPQPAGVPYPRSRGALPRSTAAGESRPLLGGSTSHYDVVSPTVLTDAGKRYPAALVLTCAGAAPSSAYCAHPASSPALAAARDSRGRIAVDACLRVVGCGPALFAIGDVAGGAGHGGGAVVTMDECDLSSPPILQCSAPRG